MNLSLGMSQIENIRACLFDLDHTLIETHIDFAEMKRKTLALGQEWGVDTSQMFDIDILGIVEHVTEICEALR